MTTRCAWLATSVMAFLLGTLASAGQATEAKALFLGNYPDPSILRDGEDYYLTHTTLRWQPALVIWHSRDLKNWKPIASAALNFNSSVWAPDLIKHGGRYHIYFPGVPRGNYLVSADDIRGPWTEPVRVENCPGIDPGHAVDVITGQRYLHASGGRAARLSEDGLRVIEPMERVYSGWPIPPEWDVECPCLESPKILARDGWYYLTSAQGGTAGPATSHMVVSARSKTPVGPWEHSPYNPIVRTWSPTEPWISKGHGTVFQGPKDRWWVILHGYRQGYRTLGRSILLEPVEWTGDGWFRVAKEWPQDWSNFSLARDPVIDEFEDDALDLRWQFFESLDHERIRVRDGVAVLRGFGETPGQSRPMAWMAGHRSYSASVELELEGDVEAGLMLFYDSEHYSGIGIDGRAAIKRFTKGFKGRDRDLPLENETTRVSLRVDNRHHDASFRFRTSSDGEWTYAPSALDVSMAHHNNWGDWHSLRPAIYATGKGSVRVLRFEYRPAE